MSAASNKSTAKAVNNNIVKISYRGLLRYLICEPKCSYQDLLAMAIERFNIDVDDATCLQLTNEHGYIFEPQLFEYFLLLFPNPQIIFYIRLDYAKITPNDTDDKDTRLPFGYSKLNNRQQIVYGAPVRRQNCFLGTLPTSSVQSQSGEFQEDEVLRKIAKRQRQQCDKKTTLSKRLAPKRSMRL